MFEDSGQNDASAKSEAGSQKEQLKKARILPSPAVCVYLLGIIAGAFCFFGGGLLNAQIFNWGWLLIFVGASFGCGAVRIWIINHRTKHRMPGWLDSNKTFVVVVLSCAIACCCAAYFSSIKNKPIPPPLPPQPPIPMAEHFEIMLNTSDSPNLNLWLTNDFLKFGRLPKFPELNADIILPVKSSNNIPALYFFVYNFSETDSPPIKVIFDIGDEFGCDSPDWIPWKRLTEQESETHSIEHDIPSMFNGTGQGLPPITLRKADLTHPGRLSIQVMTPDRRDEFWGLWIWVLQTTNSEASICLEPATNGVVNIPANDFK